MGATSVWDDLVSRLPTNPLNELLSSVNIPAANSRSVTSYSPAQRRADWTTEAHRSLWASNPVNESLRPVNIPAPISRPTVSCSPTLHCADMTTEAHRSLWEPKQSGVGKEAAREECSEVGCLHQSADEHQSKHCRYKTELCRSFEESGFCKYGIRCQFAHGRLELRTVDRHPKYKTQLCKTFHTTGLCRYGSRCHFIHNEDEGAQHHRLSPQHHHQQQQQQPVSGLRKLTGRQMSKSTEEQQLVTSATLPTFSTAQPAKELFPGAGMSLPLSTASSPSASPVFFSNDSFSSSAATEIFSQASISCQWPNSPVSESFHTTNLFTHPSILPWTADSASVRPKLCSRDDDRTGKDLDDLLRYMTKAQIELLVQCLLQKKKENTVV